LTIGKIDIRAENIDVQSSNVFMVLSLSWDRFTVLAFNDDRRALGARPNEKDLSGGHGGAVISREIRIVAAVRWSVWLVSQRFEARSNCILSVPCECSPAAKANVQPKYATSTMR
jgi:hypothetical protein